MKYEVFDEVNSVATEKENINRQKRASRPQFDKIEGEMVRIKFDAYGMQRVPSAMRWVAVLLRRDGSLWIVDYSVSRLELENRLRVVRFDGCRVAVLSIGEADRLMVYLQTASAEERSAAIRRMIGELPEGHTIKLRTAKPRQRTAPSYRGAVLPVAGWEEDCYE